MRHRRLAFGVLLLACGSDEQQAGPSAPIQPAVASIEVSPTEQTLAAIGLTQQFSAVARTAVGTVVSGQSFAWSSSDIRVATVAATSGLATAIGNGTASITATTNDVSGSATIDVQQAAASLVVEPASALLLSLGELVTLEATARDSGGSTMEGAAIDWESGDPEVVTVDESGVVTAVSNGEASVTAWSGSLSATASLVVHQRIASLRVTPRDTTIFVSAQLRAEALDALTVPVAEPPLLWRVSDPTVASVSPSGLVTAVAPGSVTVSVAVDDAMSNVPEATASVTVRYLAQSLEDLVLGFPEEGVPVDEEMLALLEDKQLVGASIAVMREGRLVMAQGYGWADLAAGAPAGPQTRFRLHSVSKMITGVAMLRAIDLGLVSLDDRPFEIFSDLSPFPGITEDPRLISVTIEQLLWFSSGLLYSYESPDHDCWRGGTLDKTQSIRCIRGLPLDADPGTKFNYTNDGHRILARVIERASGLTYDEFVSEQVMDPGNATGLSLLRARKLDRPIEEATPYPFDWEDQWGVQSALDAWDGTGGWTGTTADVLRYMRAATGGGAQPSVLSDTSARRLYERPPLPAWQPPARTWLGPMHWSTPAAGAGQYEGIGANSYGGCMYYFHAPGGTSFVFATNSSPSDCWEIGARIRPVVLAIPEWPGHDLFWIVP